MYNNFYPNNQYQSPYAVRSNNNGITWVQGIEGAKAFQLMPNSNTLLMDSENDGIFYIKTSDNVGMCSLRTFKFEELQTLCKKPENNVDLAQYVTKDELDEILNKRFSGGRNNGKQSIQSTESNKPVITK